MGMAVESQFHVLAVDDSIIDRKLIERLLKTSSYQVTTVDSGLKALEFLGVHEDDPSNPISPCVSPNIHQEVEVNLIITDYCMPGMTGYDLLKKIKESSSLRDIPVVIMSSENVPSRISRCLEEGAEEFFLKPVKLSDVNRLKPHLLKAKCKDQAKEEEELEVQQKQEQQQQQQSPQPQQQKQEQQQQQQSPQPEQQQQQQQHQQQQKQQKQEQQSPQQQQQQQQSNNSNKRKAMEEGLSPDRTRTRYSGLTVVL